MPSDFLEAQQEHVKIQNMVKNSLKMDNGTDEEEKIINNTITAAESIKNRYGIRQQVITLNSNEDSYVKAMRILNDNCKPKEDIEVECIGDLDYRLGFGVHVQIPFLSQYTDCLMYIKSVDHEWKPNGMFISKLVLTPSRVMDEQDWSDTAESDSINDSSGIDSDLWNKIYLVLKQQIGKPYKYATQGPDTFDCSGLVCYAYNQFSNEIGFTLQRTTQAMIAQKDLQTIDASNMDEWEPGDLVFPHAGHVVVYIGNGQCIEAMQTGTNVMVHDYSRKTTYAVRRVLPEVSTDTASSINSTGSKSSKYASSKLVKYTEQNEGFKANAYQNGTGWYIGYGTAYNTFPDAFNKGKSKSSTITQEKAEQYLIKYLDECGSQLNSLLATRQKSLPQNKIDALLDCMYIQGAYSLNAGSGRILLDAACGINTLISIEQAFINFVSVKERAKANYNMFKNGVYKPYNS